MKYVIVFTLIFLNIFFFLINPFPKESSKPIMPVIDSIVTVKVDTPVVKIEVVKNKPHSGNKVISSFDREYAILVPEGYTGNEVHVLFGGSHTSGYGKNSARPQAIKNYIKVMEPYCNNVIIIITHHMNSLENVSLYVKQKFNGKVTSIAGFSQGGRETWRHAGSDSLKVVGLIDPSTYATEIPFGKNTILYCDPRNWGTSGFYGQTRKRLEWYCNNSINYGDKVICFSQGGTHMNFKILKSFYDKFGDRL
jgi:hypothetical protein